MYIACSERVKREYGAAMRRAAPGARFLTASVRDGAAVWSGDPARAEVACLSADFWEDLEMRNAAIGAMFRLPNVRWFHTFSAGVDNPAFKMLIDRGVMLTNSSGASAPSIAQYVLAMMLYRSKPIERWREQQARGDWLQIPGQDLNGRTCGIIGTGAIGGEVARLAKACGMRTVGVRRSRRAMRYIDEMLPQARLSRLLKESHFVVVACPLTAQTDGMIGARELAMMRPEATLINVARGRIVDEEALVDALESGAIAGACLDVFAVEPLPAESPLWRLPNVVVTPHNSGVSPLNMERAMSMFVENLARYTAGKPLKNRVRLSA